MSTHGQILRRILVEAKTSRTDEITLANRALEALSDEVSRADTAVAAKVAVWALATDNFLPDSLAALPAPVIRAMLRDPIAAHHRQFFLASCVGNARSNGALRTRWKAGLAALEAVRVAGIYGLASKKEAQVPLSALSRAARVVAAARATATACKDVPAALLAILVLDGATQSLAALEPRLATTARSNDELDLMRELSPLGRGSPPVKALLARVTDGVAKRSRSSSALAILDAAGIEGVTAFWLQLDVSSVDQVKPYPLLPAQPRVRVRLRIDSRDVRWFWAVVDASPDVPALCFGDKGVDLDKRKLPVGGCAAEALPSWFADLAAEAKLTWDWAAMSLKTSLRAKRRQRMQTWLRRP